MKCLVLAGGFATRLYPLTINKAKALLPFQGEPVINHAIKRVPPGMEILISTNRKFEDDFRHWQTSLARNVRICVEEAATDEQKMGAVGADNFWVARERVEEDLMVLAADNYFEFDLSDLVMAFDGKNPLIAAHDVGDKHKACEIGVACRVGLVVIEEGKVKRFDEKPAEPTSSIIATGIYILPQRIFPLLSDYCAECKRDNLGSFISYLLDRYEVTAYLFASTWIDIGEEIKRGRVTV
ncbi:MAG: nucleotidyltransferase family protein [Chloroflexi bacterium]|nr:nucleotidyltransferase family protein [Chloroflexota bacterium]